ncbi:hypothetical protein H4582DRAFT_1160934 [Lactarius indigo]|nr:hypothetical protein H4582DRAFT_1160934 [Lactarius indigo]
MLLLSDVLFSERLARRRPVSTIHCSSSASLASQSQSLFCSRGDGMTRRCYTTLSLNHSPEGSIFAIARVISKPYLAHAHMCTALLLTGAALIGRRWADRQCRDRTVTVLHPSSPPLPTPAHLPSTIQDGRCAKMMIKVWVRKARISGRCCPPNNTQYNISATSALALFSCLLSTSASESALCVFFADGPLLFPRTHITLALVPFLSSLQSHAHPLFRSSHTSTLYSSRPFWISSCPLAINSGLLDYYKCI